MDTETKERKFKLGQTVKLKNDGLQMLIDSYDGDFRVNCVWFEKSSNPPYTTTFKHHSFLEDNLCVKTEWDLTLEKMAAEMK